MKEVTLPSGATVTLRDAKTLRVKDRQKVMRASDLESGTVGKALSMTDGLIAMLVDSWSFDLMLPSIRIATLGELEFADYDFLVEEASKASDVLFPKLANTIENEQDLESPFVDSNDSSGS